MLYTMPTHLLVPTLLVGEAVRYLWITCNDYADCIGQSRFCMEHIQNKIHMYFIYS